MEAPALLVPGVQDADPGSGCLGCAGDADHVRVSDGHHAEGDVLGGSVVGATDLVDLVGLGHDHGVALDDHCVRVNPVLKKKHTVTF